MQKLFFSVGNQTHVQTFHIQKQFCTAWKTKYMFRIVHIQNQFYCVESKTKNIFTFLKFKANLRSQFFQCRNDCLQFGKQLNTCSQFFVIQNLLQCGNSKTFSNAETIFYSAGTKHLLRLIQKQNFFCLQCVRKPNTCSELFKFESLGTLTISVKVAPPLLH